MKPMGAYSRRSEYPSWSRAFFNPAPVRFRQRVCHFDELAHDGHNSDLCGLSGGAQVFVFCLEIGIVTHGDKGWHVEGVPQGFATATDERSAFPLAGFARVRDEAGEAADLSSASMRFAISVSNSAICFSISVRRTLVWRLSTVLV